MPTVNSILPSLINYRIMDLQDTRFRSLILTYIRMADGCQEYEGN